MTLGVQSGKPRTRETGEDSGRGQRIRERGLSHSGTQAQIFFRPLGKGFAPTLRPRGFKILLWSDLTPYSLLTGLSCGEEGSPVVI